MMKVPMSNNVHNLHPNQEALKQSEEDQALDELIAVNRAIVQAPGKCDHCGRAPDQDMRFKAQDRLLKALAAKRKRANASKGSRFNQGSK